MCPRGGARTTGCVASAPAAAAPGTPAAVPSPRADAAGPPVAGFAALAAVLGAPAAALGPPAAAEDPLAAALGPPAPALNPPAAELAPPAAEETAPAADCRAGCETRGSARAPGAPAGLQLLLWFAPAAEPASSDAALASSNERAVEGTPDERRDASAALADNPPADSPSDVPVPVAPPPLHSHECCQHASMHPCQ